MWAKGFRRSIVIGLLQVLLVVLSSCSKEERQQAPPTPQARQGAPATTPVVVSPKIVKTPSGIEMVLIPGGTFIMGSDGGPPDARPAHRVTISSFYMDRYEVTQAAYEDLIGNNPAKFEGEKNPVEQVRWTQAARYCNERSLKEGLQPCYDEKTWTCDFSANGYRLPTEAEWEYACRAGSSAAYSFGDDLTALKAHAWFKGNSEKKTHPVGQKSPNPWGLYDMHGNVAEWCNDWYQPDYYKNSPEKDPRGPEKGEKRVIRGGAWTSPPEKCTSFFRLSDAPALPDVCLGYDDYGFRCVRRVSE